MWSFFSSYPEVNVSQIDGKTYDYVVVGGGTAGCVIASRLSEDPSVSVLVLNKGSVSDSLLSRNPLASQAFLNGESRQVVTDHWCEPVPNAKDARMRLWGCTALGGNSRLNAMILTRGSPADYTAWAEEGLDQWSWSHVEPYFRRIENAVAHPTSQARGHDGPLECRQFDVSYKWGSYLEIAAKAVGLPVLKDVNDPKAPAMGLYNLDLAQDGQARRNTAYQAYLSKDIALKRQKHLTVCTGVIASRLEVDEKADIVRGVYVQPTGQSKSGPNQEIYVKARREVILCAGALVTPQLLMLSGLGPRTELEAHGIPVVKEMPAIGQSLEDHFAVPIQISMPPQETLYALNKVLYGLWALLLWLFFGLGPMRHGTNLRSVFVRSGALDDKTMTVQTRDVQNNLDNMDLSATRNIPDLEIMIIPVNCLRMPQDGSFFSFYTCLVQPFSSGCVQLKDTNPLTHPRVIHPVLRDDRDFAVFRKGIRFSMRLAEAFQNSGYPYPTPLVFAPGNNPEGLEKWETWGQHPDWMGPSEGPRIKLVEKLNGGEGILHSSTSSTASAAAPTKPKPDGRTWETVTDEEIDSYVRTVVATSLHTSCTCRISNDESSGVVDQRLKVHGLRNLRISDTSVFPKMISTHTMLPVIMVAERCADFIKEDWSAAKDKTV